MWTVLPAPEHLLVECIVCAVVIWAVELRIAFAVQVQAAMMPGAQAERPGDELVLSVGHHTVRAPQAAVDVAGGVLLSFTGGSFMTTFAAVEALIAAGVTCSCPTLASHRFVVLFRDSLLNGWLKNRTRMNVQGTTVSKLRRTPLRS